MSIKQCELPEKFFWNKNTVADDINDFVKNRYLFAEIQSERFKDDLSIYTSYSGYIRRNNIDGIKVVRRNNKAYLVNVKEIANAESHRHHGPTGP